MKNKVTCVFRAFATMFLIYFLLLGQSYAATSIEQIRLGDGNIFYGGDGGAYRIKNESFYASSNAVKGKAVEVIDSSGRKMYLPYGELILIKLPTKMELVSKFPGAVYMETNMSSAGPSTYVNNYFVKDGYYWFVPYNTDSEGKFALTAVASPYQTVFPDIGWDTYSTCAIVYDEDFLKEPDIVNLSCGGVPIRMIAVDDPALNGIANKEAFIKRLAKDFNMWDSDKKTILASNVPIVIDWLRKKAVGNSFSDISKGYSFLTSISYDEATRKAIDASSGAKDLQLRLSGMDPLTHSGLATLIRGVGVCDGISTAGFYLYQLSGIPFYVREGEVDDTSRGGKKFPHAWLTYEGRMYDATLDLGLKSPKYKGLTATEIQKVSPRTTFK